MIAPWMVKSGPVERSIMSGSAVQSLHGSWSVDQKRSKFADFLTNTQLVVFAFCAVICSPAAGCAFPFFSWLLPKWYSASHWGHQQSFPSCLG